MSSSSYWETRYKSGGTSGSGSLGKLKDWKWSVIKKYAGEIDSIIDVGCGDLSFWEERVLPDNYIGIDISETIVERNRSKWTRVFIHASADEYVELPRARIVLCLDVLFHLMDDKLYAGTLRNLTRYSSTWIFVYTWTDNPFESWKMRLSLAGANATRGRIVGALRQISDKSTDGLYEKYRNFPDYFNTFEQSGFFLKTQEREETNRFGAMYIFERKNG